MALSLVTQWTLVASGLMAHADRVVSGEECERLMTLVDEEADGDAYAEWLTIVSDPQGLETMLEELSPPPADSHRQILEDAWLMAVVDGERVEEEQRTLERIATQLGVQPLQLELWRKAWTTAQQSFAQSATMALCWVLGGGEPVAEEDRAAVESFVHGLPTTHEHRAQLSSVELAPPEHEEEVERRLRALHPAQRRDVVQRLAAASAGATHHEEATERWTALGRALGLDAKELAQLK